MLHVRRVAALCGLLTTAAAHAISWPHETSDLAPAPDIHFAELENGLRCIVVPNAEPRGRVALRLLVLAGSLHERPGQEGLAHFVEHMAFNGTRQYPHEELTEKLQQHGFELGADVSAFTFATHTIYLLDASAEIPGHLEEAFGVLRDFADGQLFDPGEIDRERGVIESERRTRDTAASRAGDDQRRFLFPASPLGTSNPIGDPAVLRRADAAALREFYDTWYRPDNLCVIAVGDAPAERLQALIAESFGSMPRPTHPLPPAPALGEISNPARLEARFHKDPDNEGATLTLTSLARGPGGVETHATRALEFQRQLVASMLAERLADVRRQHPREVGSAFANTVQFGQDYATTTLGLSCQALFWDHAASILAREWHRALENGFSKQEIASAVRQLRQHFEYAIAAEPTQPSADRANRIAQSLVERRVVSSWQQEWQQVQPLLEAFTPKLAKEVLAGLAPSGAPRLFADGAQPPRDGDSALAAAYNGGWSDRAAPPPKRRRVALDFRPPHNKGIVVRRDKVADLGLDLVEFKNGVRLNLKPTQFNRDAVMLRARVGFGRLTEPRGQPGLALLAGSYLSSAGVGRNTGDDVRRFCEENNLSFAINVEDEAISFTGACDTPNVENLLRLFAAYLTNPSWRQEEFVATQGRVASFYSQTTHEAAYGLQAIVLRVISGDDPRFALPSPRDLSVVSLPQLMFWLQPELETGPIEVGIVGDFDADTVVRLATATLGKVAARPLRTGIPPVITPMRLNVRPGFWQNNLATTIPRAAVRVQWPIRGCGTVRRQREFEALGSVLQERIRREIRERLGATYDPAAQVWNDDSLRDAGYLLVQITTAPDDARKLNHTIREIADRLATDGVTDAELQTAVQPRLADNASRLRDNGYWLYYVVTSAQEEPARLDWPRTRESDYRSMTAADLSRLAAEFLPSSRAQVFLSGPWPASPEGSITWQEVYPPETAPVAN